MRTPNRLLFGTAGIPMSTENRDTQNGISRVKELGLGCMELEFVHSVNITKDKAPAVMERAKKEDILLTCHAPYFINLNSAEPQKWHASVGRIENSAERLYECGGWSVCFHPGFYQSMDKDKVYEKVKDSILGIRKTLDDRGIDLWLRPETTGKETQFGNFDELLRISSESEKILPVFDFSHIHARTGGKYNTEPEFREVLESVEKYTGRRGLDNMHIHLSGIAYSAKGEKNHLILKESDLEYETLLKVWKDFKIKGAVICESPNIEEDALLLQDTYNKV